MRCSDRAPSDVACCVSEGLSSSAGELVRTCTLSLRSGSKLMLFGNGGSAADAQHVATELTNRYYVDRPAIAATRCRRIHPH